MAIFKTLNTVSDRVKLTFFDFQSTDDIVFILIDLFVTRVFKLFEC